MIRYIAGRLAQTAIVLSVMSFIIFLLIGMMPGDPVDLMIASNPGATPEVIANLRHLYGLDQPLLLRYLHWLTAILSGDFGISRLHAQPVLQILIPSFVNTAWLMITSFVLSIALALLLGIVAAMRPGRLVDRAIGLVSFAGMSLPTFWLALVLILVFAVKLHWLPAGGIDGPDENGTLDRLRHLILPVATLVLATTPHFVRYVRVAVFDALQMGHIRTARAKGAGERRIVFSHALRHALIPVVTVAALSFGTLFSGALVTETMFGQPGMGKMIYDAVMGNDYNLALGGLLLATLATLLSNLTADLIYCWVDPRMVR